MNDHDVMDGAAVMTAMGSVFGYLPEIAALFAIIWTAIRIYEWVRVRILKKDGELNL
jgi:hypothetical protein